MCSQPMFPAWEPSHSGGKLLAAVKAPGNTWVRPGTKGCMQHRESPRFCTLILAQGSSDGIRRLKTGNQSLISNHAQEIPCPGSRGARPLTSCCSITPSSSSRFIENLVACQRSRARRPSAVLGKTMWEMRPSEEPSPRSPAPVPPVLSPSAADPRVMETPPLSPASA